MKILSEANNFLGLEEKFSSFDRSKIVIQSAPLEKTASYGSGTAGGPKAILDASHYVEFFDEELHREVCFEKGICTLEVAELSHYSHQEALDVIKRNTAQLLVQDKFVVTLGGEHSLSSASVDAYLDKFNHLSVLQIDAHSDLRYSYEGSKLSHASVMRRIYERTKNIVQVGIRAQCREEASLIKNENIVAYYARDIRTGKHGNNWQKKVLNNLQKDVYITFDVDGFDPSVLPSTGTPEPGGLLWDETMDLLKIVGKEKSIVGFDVVELVPDSSMTNLSAFTTAKLVYKLINYSFQ